MDAALLPRLERLLAEFHELKVTDKALPALGRNPGRINTPGGTMRTTVTRCAIRICAVHCTWYAEGGGDRDCFRRVYKMVRNGRASSTGCAVGGPASIIDHVYTRLLVACSVSLDYDPSEVGKDLVKPGKPIQIRVVEVGVAAIPEPDVSREQRKTGLGRIPLGVDIRHSVTVQVKVRPGVEIRAPLLHRNVAHVEGLTARYRNWKRKAVDEQVVPLVENRDSPTAIRNPAKAERAVGRTLGESVIFGVRISQAHVALSETVGVGRTTAVEPLVRRTAYAHGRDFALD